MQRLLVIWILLFAVSCAAAPVKEPPDTSSVRHELQDFLWLGQEDEALRLLEDNRWELTSSVALERSRQDLRLNRGERNEVVMELQGWLEENPESPDLIYLQARLLEDPVGRFQALRSLHRRHPQHSWGGIGLAATAQLLGRWRDSKRWLEQVPPSPASDSFLRIVRARQFAHDGESKRALRLLEGDAFDAHFERSLIEYLSIASSNRHNNEAKRASSELSLRRIEQSQPDVGKRIDVAFQRLLGEWHICREQSLKEILELLDGWCELTGAPSGWAQVDSYSLAGVARMVRPETDQGGVSLAWANAGRYLLAGSAIGRDKELHMFRDVVVMRIVWPRHERPIEMIAARDVMSPQARTAQGGTVFRGFYLRLDSLERGARRLEQMLKPLLSEDSPPADPGSDSHQIDLGRYESNQLPTRLRIEALRSSGSSVRDLELLHLSMHEAGHLGEILDWLDDGLPVVSVGASFLNSELDFGNPILWLEYRAQLRALASGWQPGWALAEIIERGQNPRDPYYAPYRQIFRDLVAVAELHDWPPLAQWDQMEPGSLVALARELMARRDFEPSPDLGCDRVVDSLLDFNLLEHSPGDRVLPLQLD